MVIKQIDAAETYPLRHLVLRPHAASEAEYQFEGDYDEYSLHFGLLIENQIRSVVTFHLKSDASEKKWQLRGMATHPDFNGKGLGTFFLQKIFAEHLTKDVAPHIWCNARLRARSFYERLGFVAEGEIFNIPESGQHIKMRR